MEQYYPKVGCITPTTHDRHLFNKRISEIFLQQDYLNKVHLFDYSNISIGGKRNSLCSADVDIIIHFDSDDLYAPDWISKSVQRLQESGAQLVGLSTAHFHDVVNNEVYLWSPQPKRQIWLVGASMCYYKSAWEQCNFPDTSDGEEKEFQTKICGAVNPYTDGFLATLHGANTQSHKALWAMKKLPQNEAALICDRFYR